MGTTRHHSIERAAARVTALIVSRLRQTSISDEMTRLDAASPLRTRSEIALVVAAVFGCAILAAMAGWIGLAFYFGAILFFFR